MLPVSKIDPRALLSRPPVARQASIILLRNEIPSINGGVGLAWKRVACRHLVERRATPFGERFELRLQDGGSWRVFHPRRLPSATRGSATIVPNSSFYRRLSRVSKLRRLSRSRLQGALNRGPPPRTPRRGVARQLASINENRPYGSELRGHRRLSGVYTLAINIYPTPVREVGEGRAGVADKNDYAAVKTAPDVKGARS